ncbi:MAG: hypothetical protein ACFFCV_11735 [Promethearchaeota archaeon]
MKDNSKIKKKKGKYKLLSYFIENDLIIYGGLNNLNELIAFGIIEMQDISKLDQILNEFLKKTCLNSYTIQIGVNPSSNYIILKFISIEKKEIVQDYFKLFEFLKKTEIQHSFLKDKFLEIEFLRLLCNGNASKLTEMRVKITKKGLSITNNNLFLSYIFYSIKLDLITDDIYFLQHLIKFLEEREIKGYLFLYNTIDTIGDLKGTAYFVEMRKSENNIIDLNEILNEFFKKELLVWQKPKIDLISQYLWRIPITNNLSRIDDLNIKDQKKVPTTRNEILNSIKKNLSENNIKYEIIKDFQVLINQKYLFCIFSNINLENLSKIIRDHINQYHVYILITNKNDYLKLGNYENITEISNLNILSIEEFLYFDYNLFN